MLLSYPLLTLSETYRAWLQTFVHRGQVNARTLTRAYNLLKLAEGWTEAEVGAAFEVCRNTVMLVRQRYTTGGLEAFLQDKRQQCYRQALTGTQAAHLIAIACSPVASRSRTLAAADAGGQGGGTGSISRLGVISVFLQTHAKRRSGALKGQVTTFIRSLAL